MLSHVQKFILVGCAQTAPVGDLMEVVGLLFFMCSYVCQGADLSLTPNLKGLRLDGLLPRPRGKYGGLSFAGWSWAPDSRKHYVLEVPVAPGQVRYYFLRVQGLPFKKTLPF